MKLLFADDNPLILEYFTSLLNWKDYGFDQVLSARDGMQAWCLFEKYRPEMVITDVQMPRMTGIDLTRKIMEAAPDTLVYFLSSYEEFAYVKSALELNVFGYLLKHQTKKAQLCSAIQTGTHELQKRRLNRYYAADASFRALIQTLDVNPHAALTEYEISLPDRYDLLMIRQSHIHPAFSSAFSLDEKQLSAQQMTNFLTQSCDTIRAVLQTAPYHFFVLRKPGGSVTEFSYQLLRQLKDYFSLSFSIVIFSEDSPISQCAFAYTHNRDSLQQAIFYPDSSVLHAQYLSRPRAARLQLALPSIPELINQRRFDEINQLLDQNYINCMESRDYRLFSQLTTNFLSALMQYCGKTIDPANGDTFSINDTLSHFSWYDAPSIYQWMKEKYAALYRILSCTPQAPYSAVVQNAICCVNNYYMNSDLSVEWIAAQLKISANRLNTLFKKETGETLWKLMIKVRMEKAKKLLREEQYKVSDICGMTGYNSVSYFSKVFRETYHQSPLEYRRSHTNLSTGSSLDKGGRT